MKFNSNVVIIFILLLFMSCSKKSNEEQNTSKEVPVILINKKDTIIENSFVTEIQANKNIEIRTRLAGVLQNIYVNEGQYVKKGQLLFKINDAELQMDLLKTNANLNQAVADIKIAEIEVKQLQALFDKKYIAANELDLAKAKLMAAKAKKSYVDAERQAVLQKISFTNIRAPFDGVIDVIPLKDGSLVNDGDLLTTLSQLAEVYAYFSIPESKYIELISEDKIGKHQKIELILANGDKHQYNGDLKAAEGEIDPLTGTIKYKVKFPNPGRLIKHGSTGRLVISEFQSDVILIPQKSTFSIQDKNYVYLVDNQNKVKMKNINIASTLKDSYIVNSGLQKGDKIVFEGTQGLKDGDLIQAKKTIN